MRVRLAGLATGLGIVVACALAAATAASAEPIGPDFAGDKPMPEVQDAVTKFQVRDFAGAFKKLEEACKKNSELPPPQLLMAQLFAQAKMAGGVRLWLEKAVMDVPADPEAYVIMAEFALREGRVTDGDLLYGKAGGLMTAFKASAKRKDGIQARVYAGQATVAEAREDWKNAEKLLDAWQKLDPKNANVMQRLANALFKQKKVTESYDLLKKAKEIDPQQVLTPEARLALFYEGFPDHKNAVKWMNEALKLEGEDLNTLLVAAQWALETDQIDNAKEWSSKALKIDRGSLQAKLLRGIVALFQKKYDEAELYFESAVMASPATFAASNNLALALVEQDVAEKKRKALEYAENNARAYPNLAEAASTYGWVLYKNNRMADAERALQAAASAGQLSPDTAFYIAQLSADRGNVEQAKQLLNAALEGKRPFSKREEAEQLSKRLGAAKPKPKEEDDASKEKEPPKEAPKDKTPPAKDKKDNK